TQTRAETLSFDERHRVERDTPGVAGAEDRNDVGLLERGGDLDLTLKALRAEARCELWRQGLHDDLSSEPRLLSEEDARHASPAQLALERVRTGQTTLKVALDIAHGTPSQKAEDSVSGAPKVPLRNLAGHQRCELEGTGLSRSWHLVQKL